jgi:hypothetical protein
MRFLDDPVAAMIAAQYETEGFRTEGLRRGFFFDTCVEQQTLHR